MAQMVKVVPSSKQETWVKIDGMRKMIPAGGLSVPLAFAKELVKYDTLEYEYPLLIKKVYLDDDDDEGKENCVRKAKPVISNKPQVFVCAECEKEYKNAYWLEKHRERTHPVQPVGEERKEA
jgi:hypothetical protein